VGDFLSQFADIPFQKYGVLKMCRENILEGIQRHYKNRCDIGQLHSLGKEEHETNHYVETYLCNKTKGCLFLYYTKTIEAVYKHWKRHLQNFPRQESFLQRIFRGI
jgi:hypothetical protein